MRIVAAVFAFAALAAPQALAGTIESSGKAADCNFDGAKSRDAFGRIQVFSKESVLYGCVTDVGRAYKLGPRKAIARGSVFGGDWIGVRVPGGHVKAVNLRSGLSHRAKSGGDVSALVVNGDGTLAWIADGKLRTKPRRGSVTSLGSGADAGFLGLELEGCAVTWKVDGEQRSSSIYCRAP